MKKIFTLNTAKNVRPAFSSSMRSGKQLLAMTGLLLTLSYGTTGCGDSGMAQQPELPIEPIPQEQDRQAQEDQAQQAQPQDNQNQQAQPQDNRDQQAQPQEDQTDQTQSPKEQGQENQAGDVSLNEGPENNSVSSAASVPSYFGTWEISSAIPSACCAMPDEERAAMAGTRFEYFKDYAVCNDQQRLEAPNYSENTLTADDFSGTYKGSSLEMLGISQDHVLEVSIENASGIGNTFYVKDENTLITIWNGVFFEMKKTDAQ